MKNLAATCVCLVLLSFPALAQNPAKKKAANQSRVISRSLARLVANGGGSLLNENMDAKSLPKPFQRWLATHKETLVGVTPGPFVKYAKWGTATTRGNKLYLHVHQWPKEKKLLIPRLHNSVKTVRLFGETEELKLTPNVADWEITLPEKPKQNLLPVLELELDAPAKLAGQTPPVVKEVGGVIELHSRYAIVHGEMLRFEPQPHKNTVGYWVKEKDWAEWRCEPTASGKYEVELRYGCGNGQGGSDIEITVGDQEVPFKVEATGGFQTWRDVKLGAVELKAGQSITVSAKPKMKAKNAVMDIQQITLRAAK